MTLWDSPIRIMWDPDGARLVLVPFGAPMVRLPELDGGQEVQTSGPVRAPGKRHFPRANEEHTLEFTIARIKATVEEALEAQLSDPLDLPRNGKDILLTFATSGRHLRLKSCAVERWPVSIAGENDFIAVEAVTIRCGEMLRDLGTYTEGVIWGDDLPESVMLAEDTEPYLTEFDEYLLDES